MTAASHSVRALLVDGWSEQTCDSLAQACDLFDRLRALNPALRIERLTDGRVVELASPAPGFGQAVDRAAA